jgi:hypothetical protein
MYQIILKDLSTDAEFNIMDYIAGNKISLVSYRCQDMSDSHSANADTFHIFVFREDEDATAFRLRFKK